MRAMVNVLLVEDNALLRSSLGIALGHHGVRLVASCADASEAIEHLSSGALDALIADLDLGDGPNGTAPATCHHMYTEWGRSGSDMPVLRQLQEVTRPSPMAAPLTYDRG
jgi:DNA-binding NarL/FixJ family response regulator